MIGSPARAAADAPASKIADLTETAPHEFVALAVLLAVAFAIRGPLLGNPVFHVDEHFYLLVGYRMRHGGLPLVFIFDRKPIGLFLIYAFFSGLGGYGVLAYQIAATLAAAATGWLVRTIAVGYAAPAAALAAGVLYILLLVHLSAGCRRANSPVFYNVLIALAALMASRILADDAARGAGPRRLALGCGLMLIVGCAIQIKYSVLFEGVYFGLLLLWRQVEADRRIGPLIGCGGAWVACALALTVAALAVYGVARTRSSVLERHFRLHLPARE